MPPTRRLEDGASEKHGYAVLDLLAEKAAIGPPLVPMLEYLVSPGTESGYPVAQAGLEPMDGHVD